MEIETEHDNKTPKKSGYGASKMYLAITGSVFIALTIVFAFSRDRHIPNWKRGISKSFLT